MKVAATVTTEKFIRWRYLWWALSAVGVMIAAIMAGNIWFLDFVHVFSSLLWTGIDLFMGFVLGPILRRVDFPVRRDHAAADASNTVPHADRVDHFRYDGLVFGRPVRLLHA